MTSPKTPAPAHAPHSLLSDYRPIDGVMDEMIDGQGQLRSAWKPLVDVLANANEDSLNERFARASQYLRDAGVYYRIYDKQASNERDWPLSNIPLLIDESQWQIIQQGVVQRAELLERVTADIYGNNELIQQGLLPPTLVTSNPEYLRPMAGVQPVGGHYLHFCAFELGRGPDGQWWVLGDRTQAPSGAGFALENRVATSRSFSDVLARRRVHRLAGFFEHFKRNLTEHLADTDGLIAILTPGAWNETYYEHAYIARYLGLMLLEGEDLVVRDNAVMVRTITGLKPVSVLWRRLDSAFADPLELNAESFIGTPGLVHALRNGGAATVNAIGSGVVEMRALAAFLPALAQHCFGETLTLPTIATWWCGQASERDYVLKHFDEMLIGDAMSTRLPFEDIQSAALGSQLPQSARAELIENIRLRGAQFVGQEPVQLSTTPVFRDGHLEPRPVILRVFAARDANGWSVMPGGFARVGHSLDSAAVSMQQGGQAADVWVVSDSPVSTHSMLSLDTDSFVRRSPGILPSQAAENLLWLGRYVERCEQTVRTLRAYQSRQTESSDPNLPLLKIMRRYLDVRHVDVDQAIPDGLLRNIDSALNSAGKIRDRFSPDGWAALTDLARTTHKFSKRVTPGDDAVSAMTVLLRKLSGFTGLVHENMYQSDAWRFLELGRRLERSIQTASIANTLLGKDTADGAQDMMLEIGDSVMTYRRFYSVSASRISVLDLMLLDSTNPRSVVYQTKIINDVITALPNPDPTIQLSDVARDSLQIHTAMTIQHTDSLTESDVDEWVSSLLALSNAIGNTYFR